MMRARGSYRLVDAVAEAHQPAFAALHARDEVRHVLGRSDFLEHAQDGLVRSAVQRPVQRGRRAGQRRVGIGMRAPDAAHHARAAVLLVVGVQDEQDVERPLQHGMHVVLELGQLEEHVQEVAREAEVVVRVDVRAAHAVPEGVRRDARHLRDQAPNLQAPRLLFMDLLRVRVVRRERADRREEDAHRMGVVLKPLHELLDVLVQHRVQRDLAHPRRELRARRQLAEQNQVGRFEERAVVGQLLDGVAPVEQDALVAVDVGDAAPAGRRVLERRIVGHQAEVVR